MSISKESRSKIRKRAQFCCEFCGVSEQDTGGLLTIDHFQPKSKGGTDDLHNLIYCCNRCNNFKFNYFPSSATDPSLWNPRLQDFSAHFFEQENGSIKALTAIGEFTILRLRLNRKALVAHRLNKKKTTENETLIQRYSELIAMQNQLNVQLSQLVQEQNQLLRRQQDLFEFILKNKK